MQRRSFIKMGSAGLIVSALPSFTRNDSSAKPRLALIGSGWWGMNILREAIADGRCELVAICDVDQAQLNAANTAIGKLISKSPKVYTDFRELLKEQQPEIVIVATPDHWHPLITIAAVQQGAHVYVEKPVSHTIDEGKAMVGAGHSNNRVVQVGTHRRVSPHNVSGMQFLKSGKAGQIGMVRAFVHYPGGPGEPTPDQEIPKGLDWNMWCGPAPYRNYNPTIHPKGFRQYLDYANGQLGDWGIHWMDQIMMWTDEKGPKKIYSAASRRIKKESGDSPDTQVVNFEFESFTATWEHRLYGGNEAEKTNIGCYFYGTEGTFHMGWLDGWTFYPSDTKKQIIHQDPVLHTDDSHNIRELWKDFMDSVESKKRSVCDIEIGHRATSMSLLGMLSAKAGRSIDWDPEKQLILNDPAASSLMRRTYREPWKYPL
jgi:predicted dehydrogenase